VAVAALGRLLGMGPIGALSVAAILNLVLFLVGFRLLVTRLVGNPHAAFYALVFTLVLWGLSPWRWSGFLNLNSLGFGLPLVLAAGPAVAVLDLHQQPPRHVPGRPAADLPRPGALPLVLQRLRANRRDPLGLMLLGASAVYLWGWLSGNATYGRILLFVVLVLHIVLGAWFADLELRVRRGAARRRRWPTAGSRCCCWSASSASAPGCCAPSPPSCCPARCAPTRAWPRSPTGTRSSATAPASTRWS
jgi:hypothetical protein